MARLARVVAPGHPHHITQRGNRRQQTFFNDYDYELYLSLLAECCRKANVDIWAYCLMPNHVHLIVVPETKDGLRLGIGMTHQRYTREINRKMDWRGYLWQGRFASFPMDGSYLLMATRYVELNPVRAQLVQLPEDYRWSSARFHLNLAADPIINGSPINSMVADWQSFLLEPTDIDKMKEIKKAERRGQPLGSDAFINSIK